jgi:CO/xanthine dehydrogenase Mo-binding subunit
MRPQNHQLIGYNAPRLDAPGKVTGQTLYPGDIVRPDMLHMATLFAGRPHARILGIDTSEAERAPGVVAVFTAKDVPVNEYGLQIKDQPVLCGPGSAKAGADVVRFVGDQVALVVAETEAQARAACKFIRVEWEDLPSVFDPEATIRTPDPSGLQDPKGLSPIRTPDPSGLEDPKGLSSISQLHPHSPDNVAYSYRIRKGDIERGFRAADVIVEAVYQTPVQEHAYLQPEAGVACIDDEGRVTVEVAGQWTHVDQKQIAHALDIPVEQVRVIYPAIGGAFGGREDMSVQITLALAVWRLAQGGIRRPVKTVWSREESIIGHGKRHPMRIWAKWGAQRDGKLVAAQVKVIADAGAYMYTSNKVLGNTTLTCTGPYEIPHVAVDTMAVYTNNVPSAAFRGFGGPQGCFAAESQMDRLAEALGMDPVELRLKNVLTDTKLLSTGTPIPGGVGLTEVITTAAKAAGWTQDEAGHWHRPQSANGKLQTANCKLQIANCKLQIAGGEASTNLPATNLPATNLPATNLPATNLPATNLPATNLPATNLPVTNLPTPNLPIYRGLGFAAGFKNVGFSFGYQENSYARVELRGGAEIAEATVYFAGADCGQGNHTVLAQMAAEALGVPFGKIRLIASDTALMGDSGSASASRLTYMAGNAVRGAAAQALAAWKNEDRPAVGEFVYLAPKTTPLDHDTGYGKPNFAYGYVAQAAFVAVDTETGQVKVERYVCADDVGQAINPQQVRGQIEGGVVQALGYALLEEFKTDCGRVLTDRLSTYLIPTVLDVPEQLDSIIVEVPDPNGPFGARGMGEMPYLPVAAAMAAAVYDATGVRFNDFPLTPERVWRGLKEAQRK